MENVPSSPFLNLWHLAMITGAIVMTAAAILIYVTHHIRIATIKDYKGKYDYINENEIKNYKKVFVCLGLATMMLINIYGMGKLHNIGVWFFVRLFISVAGGTLVAYVAFLDSGVLLSYGCEYKAEQMAIYAAKEFRSAVEAIK